MSNVLRLLELFEVRTVVPWNDIPAELHDAWRIACDQGYITFDARLRNAERHEAYRQSLNVAYWITEPGRDALALLRESERPALDADAPPDNYADFRNGPNDPLLTAKECWERFGVSGSELSKLAKKRPGIRRRNPCGRGFVYRRSVVAELADRRDEKRERDHYATSDI